MMNECDIPGGMLLKKAVTPMVNATKRVTLFILFLRNPKKWMFISNKFFVTSVAGAQNVDLIRGELARFPCGMDTNLCMSILSPTL
jgi:hypothetical protein